MAGETARLPPRWFVETFWRAHRRVVRASGGRRGLWAPKPGKWGALRLFFLWLLEEQDVEAYLRGEAEHAREVLAELEAIAAQEDPDTPKTRAYRVALELGLRSARARLEWAEWAHAQVRSGA
jgi:hypothetical protein